MNTEEQIEQEQEDARALNKENDTTIELVDIDYAILTYIKEKIADKFIIPSTQENVNVAVLMKKPERWIDKKDIPELKDITGNHYKFPIIGIARNGIDIQRTRVPHHLDDESLSYIINKDYKASNKKDGQPYYTMVRRPVHINANYEFEIISDNQAHVNYLTEQFVYHEGKYWTDNDSYRFRTSFQSVLDGTISPSGAQERLVISSISATCSGYILPKYRDGESKNIMFIESIKGMEFGEKLISPSDIKKGKTSIWD